MLIPSGRNRIKQRRMETSDTAVPAPEAEPSNVMAITAPAGAEAKELGAAYSKELPIDPNDEIRDHKDL